MSSRLPSSRSNPSLYQSATTRQPPADPAQEHTTKFSHRIRHMFDSSKYVVFLANVTVHELGNVPQLEGVFSVRWKYRGRRPRGTDGPPVKPSSPNLKLNRPLSTIHPSASTISLQSTSTSTTSTSSPVASVHPSSSRIMLKPPSSAESDRTPKANTTPLEAITPVPSQQAVHKVEKKLSDPTPLRQVSGPQGYLLPATSPEMVEEPLDDEDLDAAAAGRMNSAGTGSSGRESTGSGSGSGSPNDRALLPSIAVRDFQPGISRASSSSHLNVPPSKPRLASNHPPARSGTLPSPSTLIDSLRGEGGRLISRPEPISRTASVASYTNGLSHKASSTTLSLLNLLSRSRQASGAGGSTTSLLLPAGRTSSASRKGTTPGRRLKAHTCTWDYDLQHAIRIPLGKAVPAPAPSRSLLPLTPRAPAAPLLGAGPLSDSGIRLIVEQLPTLAATSAQPATGAKDSLPSVVRAVHRVDHAKGNPSEEGRLPRGAVDGDKTVFGMVDVDLAAFAGKGRTTRRFLLKGSKTNATIKLTVELKWIGGEEKWTAPPMQDGHHVTGMHDLVGTEAQDNIRNDLKLAETPSNTSSSSNPSSHLRSGVSSTNISRNVSAISLSGPPPDVGHKSFEHHLLKPDDARRLRPSTPSRPPSGNNMHHHHHEKPGHRLSPVRLFRSHHHHHSHHIRERDDDPATPKTGIHELPPEVIIEAVFNPHPATEEGPFTFVPLSRSLGLDPEDAILDRVFDSADPSTTEDDKMNGSHRFGWGGRMRARKERKER